MVAAWRKTKLGKACRFKYGEMPKKSDLTTEGYPVYSGYRLVGHSPRYHYRDSEIIVVARGIGGTGDIKMTPRFCFLTNLSIAILLESPELHKPFLFYRLASTTLWELRTGSAQAQITIEHLKDYEIEFPPLPLQRRIAGILSAYDELIENGERRIRILEAMARALYREWFVHLRFPRHEKALRMDSPLGPIPKGWEVKAVGEIAETLRGRSYRSVDLAEEGGLPFLNLKCLDRDGGFRRSGLKRYIGEYKDSHVARKGDIVMAVTDMTQERRIIARAALVPTLGDEFGICSMDLVRIEPKPPMPKSFLYCFLRFSSFADEVKQHANGANVLHLSPERITDFRFPVSTPELMSRFRGSPRRPSNRSTPYKTK